MSEENGKFELEGTVEEVYLDYHVLYVLIKDADGLLYNTTLENNDTRFLEQLEHTIEMHKDRVKVTVEKDTKATRNKALPIYKVLSQYQLMQDAE